MKYVSEGNEIVDLQLEPREIERQWERFLRFMVVSHREQFPEDTSSTPELCELFMERLLRRGFIEQDEDGVYQLPRLVMSN